MILTADQNCNKLNWGSIHLRRGGLLFATFQTHFDLGCKVNDAFKRLERNYLRREVWLFYANEFCYDGAVYTTRNCSFKRNVAQSGKVDTKSLVNFIYVKVVRAIDRYPLPRILSKYITCTTMALKMRLLRIIFTHCALSL